MALFKVLKGESDRISFEDTPFHEGYAYFTTDETNGGFYIDANDGVSNKRYHVNEVDATLTKTGIAADAAAVKQAIDNIVISGGNQKITASDTAPENPNNGDNWLVSHTYS